MTFPRFDPIVHAPNRLQICAYLSPLDRADFPVLRELLDVSDSVLSKHLKVLEDAGYLKIEKITVDSRVRTQVSLTRKGRRAYGGHIAELQRLVATDPEASLESRNP